MTLHRIYELAWLKALDNWERERSLAEHNPTDEIAAARERLAFAEVTELGARLYDFENKED